MKIAPTLRTPIAQQILAALADGTSLVPRIMIYTGTMPSTMSGSLFGLTKLAELDLSAAVGSETDGTIIFDAIASSDALASGTATWARIVDADSFEVLYLTVSDTNGAGELQMSQVNLVAGISVNISSVQIQVGE
jgi:hypothetical protein